MANDDNVKMIGNIINYHFVYPKSKHILDLTKKRGLANLPNLESICYILAQNPLDELLKESKNPSVKIMMDKYQGMLADNELLTQALKAEMLELLLPDKLKEYDQIKYNTND